MATWIAWILIAGTVLFFFSALRFSHRKRLHLRNYIIFLLLNDNTRSDHKGKFEQWIRESGAKDAMQLGQHACNVIEHMADSLAGSVPLGAHSALWNSDAATELRNAYGRLRQGSVKAAK